MSAYIESDEEIDALISLKTLELFIVKYQNDEKYIKWLVISLHSTLQCFMILALRGTNGLLVLSEKSAISWLESYENNTINKQPLKMDTFSNLYKKIKSDKMMMWLSSKKFISNQSQDHSVKSLDKFRNEFTHYLPKTWLIEKSMIAPIVNDCLEIIKFLAKDSGNIFYNKSDVEEDVNRLIEQCLNTIKTL